MNTVAAAPRNQLVDQVIEQLRATGGELTRSRAMALLRAPQRFPQLTSQEVAAVLARFPETTSKIGKHGGTALPASVIGTDDIASALRTLAGAIGRLAAALTPAGGDSPQAAEDHLQGAEAEGTVGGRRQRFTIGPEQLWTSVPMRLALARHDWSRVFDLLRQHGVSQRRIGNAIGATQSEVSEIVNGRRVSAWPVLRRYADGLGVPLGWVGLAFDSETAAMVAADGGSGSS